MQDGAQQAGMPAANFDREAATKVIEHTSTIEDDVLRVLDLYEDLRTELRRAAPDGRFLLDLDAIRSKSDAVLAASQHLIDADLDAFTYFWEDHGHEFGNCRAGNPLAAASRAAKQVAETIEFHFLALEHGLATKESARKNIRETLGNFEPELAVADLRVSIHKCVLRIRTWAKPKAQPSQRPREDSNEWHDLTDKGRELLAVFGDPPFEGPLPGETICEQAKRPYNDHSRKLLNQFAGPSVGILRHHGPRGGYTLSRWPGGTPDRTRDPKSTDG